MHVHNIRNISVHSVQYMHRVCQNTYAVNTLGLQYTEIQYEPPFHVLSTASIALAFCIDVM